MIFICKQKLYKTLFTCCWSNVIAKVVNCTEIVELLMDVSPTLGAGVISKGTGRQAWFLHVLLIQQLKWTSEKRFREWKLETLKHEKITKAAEDADSKPKMMLLPVFANLLLFLKTCCIDQHSDSISASQGQNGPRKVCQTCLHIISCDSYHKPLE